jgi:hypothetical protein
MCARILFVTPREPASTRELRNLRLALIGRRPGMKSASVEAELSGSGPVSLTSIEHETFQRARRALAADVRFEHLGSKVDDALWAFVRSCIATRGADQVAAFVTQHARDLFALVCYLPVEFLTVSVETPVLGIRLLPMDDSRIPTGGPGFEPDPPIGCVAAVDVAGTSHASMANRARTSAEHALRVLRLALRAHRLINDWQLRFRLADSYAFSDVLKGWARRSDSAFPLGLGRDLVELAMAQPVAGLPPEPTSDIEHKADVAMRWLERSRFAGEPLVALLYLCFALEALIGDSSERLKGPALAYRQAMLSHVVGNGFIHPNGTLLLYDQIRSAAVHGEHVPPVEWDAVRTFSWVVHESLNDYLVYARAEGFTRRSDLVKSLRRHPDGPSLIAWLRHRGGTAWQPFLDGSLELSIGTDSDDRL